MALAIMTNPNQNEGNDVPKVWVSLGAKINTGNYENQEVQMGVSNVPVSPDQEYINAIISQAQNTLRTVVEGLASEMSRVMREDYGR